MGDFGGEAWLVGAFVRAAAPLGLSCTEASKGLGRRFACDAVLASGIGRLGDDAGAVAFLVLAYFVVWRLGSSWLGRFAARGICIACAGSDGDGRCRVAASSDTHGAGFALPCLLCVLVHGVNLLLTAAVWGWRLGKRDTAEAGDCVRWSGSQRVLQTPPPRGRPLGLVGWWFVVERAAV